jgi:exosortase
VTAIATRARVAVAPRDVAPLLVAAAAFLILFANPLRLLAIDWWTDPDAGHGLLLAPLALWLAWRAGLVTDRRPQRILGSLLLGASVLLRYLAGLAAEMFTMRLSIVGALLGIVLFVYGWRQAMRWWLPIVLFTLSIPLPSIITNTIALPLQFKASQMGAALLEARHVPVRLTGNVIMLPGGHRLFVTEACSGLRSLTALLSLGVLIGGLWLKYPLSRVILLALAIPVAVLINGVRVFLTGFLVFFVSPALGEGFMHVTEGWLMFIVAFAILGLFAWITGRLERTYAEWRTVHAG